MPSFSRGFAALSRHGLTALCTPCQPLSASHPSSSLIFRSARMLRLLPPSSPNSPLFFSSVAPRAAPKSKPRFKSKSIPAAAKTAPAAPLPRQARPSPSSPSSSSSPPPPPQHTLGAARTLADQLGRRASPTLLYEAPSHFWFRMSCISAGTFCIGYTVYHYWTIYLKPPPDLAWWVPHAFGLICIVMAALGGYFIFGSARIIRTVQALPTARLLLATASDSTKTLAKTPKTPAAAQRALAASQTPNGLTPPILLEVEIGRMLPLLSPRKLYVTPMAMALPMRLASLGLTGERSTGSAGSESGDTAGPTGAPATGYERVLARRAEEERLKKLREYEMDHLMTAPFRHAWQGARVAWRGIGRAFSRDGFLPVEIEGQRYKLDVSGGWALEKGRALDRLVAIKEGQLS